MKQILVFILFSTLLCWLLFAPVYKHVVITRQALLQQEVDYLLEIGANGMHGFIDDALITASRDRLARRGFQSGQLVYDVSTTNGAVGNNPSLPVPRGVGIELSVSYPYENVLAIDRLIGITPPDPSARMKARGMKMSEYVR